jgi:membrane-bound serine protease (ClpP class)
VLLVGAILLAVFGVVEGAAAIALVAAAAAVEVTQGGFWIWYSRRRRAVTGAEALVGATARVVDECNPRGTVRVHGELWRACCPVRVESGELVRIVALRELTLDVEPTR